MLRLLPNHFTGIGGLDRNGPAGTEKNDLKPWQHKEWCIPSVSPAFVWHMEDVLDLYAEPYDARRPHICFDESPVQLISEVRHPLPTRPGHPARYD